MLKMKTQLTGNISRSTLQRSTPPCISYCQESKKKEMRERSDMRNAVYTSVSTTEKNRLKHSIISLADNIPSPVCVV